MILITGASGNVGQEVLRQIANAGRPVRAAYQSASKAATAPAGVETVLMDFNQPETVRAALQTSNVSFWWGLSPRAFPSWNARPQTKSNNLMPAKL
jgi:nucleoside-diphosphate-sugar epimerase